MRNIALIAACMLSALVSPAIARAQVPDLALDARLVFYGDDTELSNPFSVGRTTLGTFGVAALDARFSDRLTIRAGAFGNWRSGSDRGVDQARPVLAFVITDGPSQFVLGTLNTARHLNGAGPDLTGLHGLLPPMQRETLAFERPHESGLQWIVDSQRFKQDAWINWQRLNTRLHREIFDAGVATRTWLRPALSIRGDVHIVHQGGINPGTGETVADSVAAAAGVEAAGPVDRFDRVSLELAALGSRHEIDRAHPEQVVGGFASFLRFGLEDGSWRVHLILWRARNFIKEEGDPLYQSVLHDGARYRNIRDYGELGISRRFALAANGCVEASLRLHRVEANYDYSFRIVGIANLHVKLTR